MAEAKYDNNGVSTILGTSSTDGVTPRNPTADPSNHTLDVNDGTTGSDLSDDIAGRDNNYRTVIIAVSELDGITPVEVYVNSSGELLVDSS